MNKIKVVLSGLIYPWTMLHFFWRAFKRREDIELCVLGPFFEDEIPWNGGIRLPRKYVAIPDVPLPSTTASRLMNPSVLGNLLPFYPDLWLQVDAGWRMSARPPGEVVAHVQTDPHVLKELYKLPKSYSDYVFCMQGTYMEDGEIYLPYGYDPTIHYPLNVPWGDREYDACLIGLHYTQRTALVSALRENDIATYYSIGEIMDEYREQYNHSKIALSWSSMQDLPSRVWEAFGMGIPLLTNRVPDLANFFVEDDHYLGFDTIDEALLQAKWILDNPEQAQGMAECAQRKVEAGHTWDHRINQLLKDCKLIS